MQHFAGKLRKWLPDGLKVRHVGYVFIALLFVLTAGERLFRRDLPDLPLIVPAAAVGCGVIMAALIIGAAAVFLVIRGMFFR